MPVPTRTALGATTLNRMWYLDVDTSADPNTPVWIGVFGLTEFQPALEPTLQDDSDFDSGGYKSQSSTALQWSLVGKLRRGTKGGATPDPTAYDPGQEALRLAAAQMGTNNRVHVRWYEMTENGPRVEAYEGYATVTWSPDGGAMDANNLVSITLTGQGKRTAITHPDTAAVAAPVVTSLDPTTGSTAGGTLVAIHGTGLAGATSVKFGANAVAAANFDVVSDTLIEAVAPAGAAGQVDVTVTTPGGTSGTSTNTKFTYA